MREQQTKMLEEFKAQNFSDSLSELEESEINKNEKNRLLYLMERGTLLYYKKDFYRASKVFNEANELVDKLYTKSIREKITSSLINENSNTFHGSIFERSLLFYYQAMSFYQLSKQDFYINSNDKKVKFTSIEKDGYLASSRSSLLAWDTFFKELKRSSRFKSILQADLLSKSLAGKLHEQMGTKRDSEIALQLYKDALDILKRFGPAYSVFNKDYIEYNNALASVLKGAKKSSTVSSRKIDSTGAFEQHEAFLQGKILRLSQRIRPREYKKLSRKFKRKAAVARHKRIEIVLEVDYINRLQSKNFAFNLNTALSNIEDPNTRGLVEGIGVPVLTYFALGNLGLGYVSQVDNVSIYSSHNAGTELTKELGVEFQLPYIAAPKTPEKLIINILNNKNKVVSSQKMILLSSFDDLSFINSQEMIESSFSKRSLRVGIKYVVAIAAAYVTYQQVAENSSDFLARAAALSQFLVSTKAIAASEQADDRHWSTLPAFVGQAEFDLPNGDYSVQVVEPSTLDSAGLRVKAITQTIGTLSVDSDSKSLFTYRHF